jgi:trehalose 6-phosphate phosphatase
MTTSLFMTSSPPTHPERREFERSCSPRRSFQATVTAVEAELRSGRTVHRYRRHDGLPGQEGGFHLYAAWMIEACLMTGRCSDAEELFSQLVDIAGPTGLLPEKYDPAVARSLGNLPQAYGRMGLTHCARLVTRWWAGPRRTCP